ncbi:hypothetical protein J3459_021544 [Metarhizium acridum]|nr:hypothetical protein J3459_021544 [Metarhizium acridum]
MSDVELQQTLHEVDLAQDVASPIEPRTDVPTVDVSEKTMASNLQNMNGELETPITPIKSNEKPLPKEPMMTPRIKKKVPWKGKNIMVLVPRDDQRGQAGGAPMPLRPEEVEKMFHHGES